jgi:SAM-dependent methyltransferase
MKTYEQNREFYNGISANYNAILDQESSNQIVRNLVKKRITDTVKTGRILDFGGGTGLDLDWLINNYERVVFCEPSEGMRQKAIEKHSDNNVIFLKNNEVDFTTWQNKLPFSEKVDGIISDFAVFNCIEDINLLFTNLALVIKPGGHLFALMLNPSYKKTWKWKLRNIVRQFFSSKTVVIHIQYETYKQIAYVYSPKEIKKASMECFEMVSKENIAEFTLFNFKRR